MGTIGGGGELEEKASLTRPNRGVIGPNWLSNQAPPSWDNLSTWRIRKIEGCNPPEEAEEQFPRRRQEEGRKSYESEAEEDHGDAQIKEEGKL